MSEPDVTADADETVPLTEDALGQVSGGWIQVMQNNRSTVAADD